MNAAEAYFVYKNFIDKHNSRRKVPVRIRCSKCGKTVAFNVYKDDLDKWHRRAGNIQNIFPYLTPGQREMFITQTCDECWEKMFK